MERLIDTCANGRGLPEIHRSPSYRRDFACGDVGRVGWRIVLRVDAKALICYRAGVVPVQIKVSVSRKIAGGIPVGDGLIPHREGVALQRIGYPNPHSTGIAFFAIGAGQRQGHKE